MSITKICRRCGQTKPLEELVKHKDCTYGVDALCKVCNAEHFRNWYANNREKAHNTRQNYREVNRQKLSEYQVNKQRENRDAYYARHKAWRDRNRPQLRARSKAWREANPEKARAQKKASKQANPEVVRSNVRKRRARKRNASGIHTAADVRKQLEYQNDHFYWCSQPLNGTYHVDHVIPLIRGGSNSPENIVCTCVRCNCSKGDKLPYMEWQPPCPLFPDERKY